MKHPELSQVTNCKVYKKSLVYQTASVLIVDLLPFMCGVTTSWPSPVIPKLLKEGDDNTIGKVLTVSEVSWIGSLLALGAIIGPTISAYSSEKFGRKWSMIGIAAVFAIAAIILTCAQDVYTIYAGRLISGISQGSVFTIIPLYFSEISKNTNRGIIGNTIGLSMNIGSLTSYVIGPFVSILTFNIICLIWPCLFLILSFFLPETPHYLIKKGEEELARDTYLRLGIGSVDGFEETKIYIKSKVSTPINDIFKSTIHLKIVTIALLLVSMKQLSGATSIITYSQYIFDVAGTQIPSEISSIIVACIGTVGGITAPFIVDRYGRKIMLVTSLLGTMLAQILLGLYFFLDSIKIAFWIPIMCLVICIFFNIFGVLSTVWIVMAEILPERIKSSGSAVINSIHWLLQFTITFVFPIASADLGMDIAFWIFAVLNFIGVMFILFFLPETKEKSAVEIEQLFNKKSLP